VGSFSTQKCLIFFNLYNADDIVLLTVTEMRKLRNTSV